MGLISKDWAKVFGISKHSFFHYISRRYYKTRKSLILPKGLSQNVVIGVILSSALFSCISFNKVNGQITITDQTSYHKASYGPVYGSLESGTIDNGGMITLFIKNTGNLTDSLSEIKISKNGIYDTSHYSLVWPKTMEPGGSISITLKGLSSPFGPGDTVLIEASTLLGYTDQQQFVNEMPGLRIANIIPSHDLTELFIYLRNDQNTDAVFNSLELNNSILTPGSNSLTFINPSAIIPPNQVAILKVRFEGNTFMPLSPIRLNIKYSEQGMNKNVSTFQRLVKAEYPIGTWHSPLANNDQEEGRKIIRKLSITSVFGPNDVSNMSNNLPEYFMKVVREPEFFNNNVFVPSIGAQYVSENSNNPIFHYWNVEDEPDLSNKPIKQEMTKNMTYWENDTNTPSFINLASQKNYQRYGFFADIVSMDHYSDDGPPNVIPFPYWYTTEGSVREALEYTSELKKNTEPKRMSTWCQLISTAFSNQAEPHVINFQFWSHIAEGAKGIYFFTAKPNHPAEQPALWEESKKLTHQLNGVKNLCLYSEPFKGVNTNSGNVIAKSLVGTDAMAIVLLNNSIDYTQVNVINHVWVSTITPQPFDIEFTVPEWISLDEFYETDHNGKLAITNLTPLGGRTFRITGTINERTKVFVIGKNDTIAPNQIDQIIVADQPTPSDFTLSWNEPLDNFGVKGYYILADDQFIDTVRAPIWESAGTVNGCDVTEYKIIPFDDALNTGIPTAISIDWSSYGTGTPVIYTQPNSQTVGTGVWCTFIVADSSATQTTYQWQTEQTPGSWTDLQNGSEINGVFTSTLNVKSSINLNETSYRCIVNAGCTNASDTSNAALLNVINDLSVTDLSGDLFQLFPNPSNGEFKLISNRNNFEIRITDQTGRTIFESFIKDKISDIKLFSVSPGLYNVWISDPEGNYSSKRKMMIQNF
jgi:hypothetical protein